jgi:hypothetical protein
MPARKGFVPIDELREVLAARLATMSLRSVARAVGMSPSGLQKFMDGAVPYLPTREKLERWHVREVVEGRTEMTEGSALAALAALGLLVRDLPPGRQEEAVAELVKVVWRWYEAADGPRPAWLDPLAREVGVDPGG